MKKKRRLLSVWPSRIETRILAYLHQSGPSYGQRIVHQKPRPTSIGSVYYHLDRLQRRGLVVSYFEPGDRHIRFYRCTRLGVRLLNLHREMTSP